MPASEFNFKTDAPMAGSALTALHEFFCGNRAEATPDTIAAGDALAALLRIMAGVKTVSPDAAEFALFEHTPSDYQEGYTGAAKNRKFRWVVTATANPGGNPRKNDVMAFGWNVAAESVAADPTDHAFGLWIESSYGSAAGGENVECYLQGRTAGGVAQRPFGVVWNRVTGTELLNLNSPNVQLSNPPDEDAAVNLGATGPLNLSSGSGTGQNGAFSLTVGRSDGSLYLNYNKDYGCYLDLRSRTDVPGWGGYFAAGQTDDMFYLDNGDLRGVPYRIDHTGAVQFPTLADSEVANNRLYFGSDHGGQLCRKDSGGSVHTIG